MNPPLHLPLPPPLVPVPVPSPAASFSSTTLTVPSPILPCVVPFFLLLLLASVYPPILLFTLLANALIIRLLLFDSDHDRPLTTTGQSDAAKVALKLQQLGWIPKLILLSDAVRTRETLKIMQENAPAFLDAEVRFIPSFYSIAAMDGQTAEHLQLSVCKHSTDKLLTVMCMGHNRGWEEAASMFTGTTVELKTCNAALPEATGKSWEEALALAGLGGWKLQGIVKPSNGIV